MTAMADYRTYLRGALHGALLMLVMSVGYCMQRGDAADEAIAAADAQAQRSTDALLTAARQSAATLKRQRELSAAADSASARIPRQIPPRPRLAVQPDTTPAVEGDTVAYVLTMRATDVAPFRVPKFLVDEVVALDSLNRRIHAAWQLERAARMFADTVTIPDLRRQLEHADQVIRDLRVSIAERDRVRQPRCGRKCGMVIGAVVTLTGALALDQLVGLVRPD